MEQHKSGNINRPGWIGRHRAHHGDLGSFVIEVPAEETCPTCADGRPPGVLCICGG
jgi:hypothetical protein